jgi:hypothetical protein
MVTNGNSKSELRAPVYIPFKTFLNAVEVLEQGLPDPLDRSVWPSWSGGVQSQTLGAFKFLGLIDEKGNVQNILHRLVDAKSEERKTVVKEIIEERYKEAVKLGEVNSTFQQLQDLFRQYGVESGTLERVTRFFLDSCEYTGIKCSAHWAKAKKTARRQSKKDDSTTNDKTILQHSITNDEKAKNIQTIQLKSGGTISLSVVVDLISLSTEDREWLFKMIDQFKEYMNKKSEQNKSGG